MPLETTVVGSWPKPPYLTIPDWWEKTFTCDKKTNKKKTVLNSEIISLFVFLSCTIIMYKAKKRYSKFCDILWQVLRKIQTNLCRFSEKGNFSEEAQAKLTGMGGGFDPRWIFWISYSDVCRKSKQLFIVQKRAKCVFSWKCSSEYSCPICWNINY